MATQTQYEGGGFRGAGPEGGHHGGPHNPPAYAPYPDGHHGGHHGGHHQPPPAVFVDVGGFHHHPHPPPAPYGYAQPYVTYAQPPPPPRSVVVVSNGYRDDPTCAQLGCVFSLCVPLIGCITYCWNSDAPRGSARKRWANYALWTAFIVCVIAIISSLLGTQTGEDDTGRRLLRRLL